LKQFVLQWFDEHLLFSIRTALNVWIKMLWFSIYDIMQAAKFCGFLNRKCRLISFIFYLLRTI